MWNKFICSKCGHIGSLKVETKGNLILEILLWLFFLLPGIIYTIYRHSTRKKVCSMCGSLDILPVKSPVGQKMVDQQEANKNVNKQ